MVVKKRRIRTTKIKVTKADLINELEAVKVSLNDRKLIADLEQRCLYVENQYYQLRKRLIDLLLPEQIEAAKICGCSPEMYALEWIEIYKTSLRATAPAYSKDIQSFSEMRRI